MSTWATPAAGSRRSAFAARRSATSKAGCTSFPTAIKGVINYSKSYVVAEVDMTVPADTNLDEIFHALTEAGRRLRLARKEVLSETVIKGVVDLTLSNMTVRAATKVRPGTHLLIQSEYRRLLKQVLDEQKAARPPALAA
jgi:hypothetical protein